MYVLIRHWVWDGSLTVVMRHELIGTFPMLVSSTFLILLNPPCVFNEKKSIFPAYSLILPPIKTEATLLVLYISHIHISQCVFPASLKIIYVPETMMKIELIPSESLAQ